jgi:hypothetical protein
MKICDGMPAAMQKVGGRHAVRRRKTEEKQGIEEMNGI